MNSLFNSVLGPAKNSSTNTTRKNAPIKAANSTNVKSANATLKNKPAGQMGGSNVPLSINGIKTPGMMGGMKHNGMMGGMMTVGSRRCVWNGTADHTSGGLRKSALMMHKGRIVSRKAHAAGKKAYSRLVKAGYKAKKGTFKLFSKRS